MRIPKNETATFPTPPGLAAQAENVLQFAGQIGNLQGMLCIIRRDCEELRDFFLTEAESSNLRSEAADFDAKMQSLVLYTSENLKNYQMSGWEELLDREENRNGISSDS